MGQRGKTMKSCDTPLCDGMTVRAALCRPCYERKRWADPMARAAKIKRMKRYAKRDYVRQAHLEACRAYRQAGKVEPGECLYCQGPTSGIRARRCLRCYRARVLPVATRRGLQAIHGRLV